MSARDDSPEWSRIPRAELAKLDSMLDREKREFRFRRWLDGGYSGSPVAIIRDKQSGRASIERILKFCSQGKSEVLGTEAAYELAPDNFKSNHLVKNLRGFQLSSWYGMLMEIAGGDLSAPSLADYATDEHLADICRELIHSLLVEWNEGERELNEDLKTGAFLRRVIGPDKIKNGGSLRKYATRAGISWNDQWIQRNGWSDWLRNPLAMLSEDYGAELSAMVGIGHGDLSVFNVLIPGLPNLRPLAYYLIDYGSSTPSHPLARDPMYLLLSLATRWLQEIRISSEVSRSLISLLAFNQDTVKSIFIGPHQKVFNEIVQTGHDWARLKGSGHHWIPQCQLSIIGCSLSFIGRKIDSLEVADSDDWLFDLAAVAATTYWQKHEKEPLPPRPDALLPEPIEASPWEQTDEIQALIEELDSAVFSRNSWTELELGTRDLRTMINDYNATDFGSGARISALIAELRRILDGTISPLASSTQLTSACRQAEDLRERLLTLLRV